MAKIGVIAGSGFYEMEGIAVRELKKLSTPYGEPSDIYRIGELAGVEVAFLSRHGTPHQIPPHRINYRANIWGFRELGVERILSVNAVGGIRKGLSPGELLLPDQVIDMTHGRASTFYEGNEVVHIDFTMPFCDELRRALITAGRKSGLRVKKTGTYLCVNGPRLESKAEIRYFSQIGGDIVGMTVMPEACLARELELCFAGIGLVTNPAAGISAKRLTTTEVLETMKNSLERIRDLMAETVQILPEKRSCDCQGALGEARM
ncbi:MAG: S-methyl-5'-thioadenosine phosphorylase [Nitrospirae bacterium]|nr:S-methyl-5'-thioadenosine phosphorylase [Nitrospirota bacterium]